MADEREYFHCASCGESFPTTEYSIEVDDHGDYATFCCWDCLLTYPDGFADGMTTREGAVAAHAAFEELLARIMDKPR